MSNQDLINHFLEDRVKVHSNHKTYRTNFFQEFSLKDFLVGYGVFRPECSPVTVGICKYLINNKKVYLGRNVCDLGCGSGIFAVIMAKNGASKVTAIDILDAAVQNTKKNAMHYNLENIIVKKSNLFQNIVEESFKLIIANFPTFLNNLNSDFNLFIDKKMSNIFFKECKSHLQNNGKIILPCTYIQSLETIDYKKIALKNGFDFGLINTKDIIYNNKKIGISILYEFFR